MKSVLHLVNLCEHDDYVYDLQRHIDIVKRHGVACVVCINRFPTDTDAECELACHLAVDYGAHSAVVATHYGDGGKGALELAKAIASVCDTVKSNVHGQENNAQTATKFPDSFRFLYPLSMPIADKIRTIACQIYGAKDVEFLPAAQEQLERYSKLGYDNLPICMSKTHLSFSHDASAKGAPRDFVLPIRAIGASTGAGFLIPMVGTMTKMPGLPTRPAFFDMSLDPKTGEVFGLF